VIDRVLNWVERLPGPPEAWFAGAGVLLSQIGHAVLWATGTAFPQIEPELIVAPVMAGMLLALSVFMRRTADAAFDDFRPALANPDVEEVERHRLLSIPDRAFLASAVVITVMTTALYLAFVGPSATPRTPTADSVITAGWIVFSVMLGLVISQIVSQLRSVRHLSEIAQNIDVLNPGPVDALSRVTAVGGIGMLTFLAVANIGLPGSASGYVALDVGIIVFALVAFLLPLQVMHRRLDRQKADLLAASRVRLKSVLGALHSAVDAHDYTSADALNKMVATTIAERDLLMRLQTWPWTPTTIRGFASALLLPVIIFVITRGIDRLLV
jgi:hypothetical protein